MLRLYDFECGVCETVVERMVRHDEPAPKCQFCKTTMRKLISAPRINMGPAGATGYYDETLGTYIHTNRQWKEECRRQGVTPKGDTPK